jgi:cation:H+ antiporter
MIIHIISVIAGFMLLIKGADYLVDGSTSLARRMGVSTLVIGLTVVAFGTSAPELVVNIVAAFSGTPDIALGNINGTNIANVFLILGIAALFVRIPVKTRTVWREVPFMLFAGLLLVLLLLDRVLTQSDVIALTRIDGLILLLSFAVFLYYLFVSAQKTKGAAKVEQTSISRGRAFVLTGSGFAGLIVGGHLTVRGASELALSFGVSETLVALTIVAIGTSLPELAAAVTAARKGHTDLAIGNVVGSTVFNILLVLGLTATISPKTMVVDAINVQDAIIAFGAMLVMYIALFIGGRSYADRGVGKRAGIVFLVLYVAYFVFVLVRG